MDVIDRRIAEGLSAGLSQRAVGRQLGISGPAISQRVARSPDLRRLRTATSAKEKERLAAYRSELAQVLVEVRHLAIDIAKSIRVLDEELDSIRVDTILGLR